MYPSRIYIPSIGFLDDVVILAPDLKFGFIPFEGIKLKPILEVVWRERSSFTSRSNSALQALGGEDGWAAGAKNLE